jgi:hypothetical protein
MKTFEEYSEYFKENIEFLDDSEREILESFGAI